MTPRLCQWLPREMVLDPCDDAHGCLGNFLLMKAPARRAGRVAGRRPFTYPRSERPATSIDGIA
jgi:hypothetical protein